MGWARKAVETVSGVEDLIASALEVDARVRQEREFLRARERALKAERAEAIQAASDGGVTAIRLAEEFGINRVTLYKLMRDQRNS